MKKKSESIITISLKSGIKARLKVYISLQIDENVIYQVFRFVSLNPKHIKYFFDSRFNGFYKLQNLIDDFYIGDGENIVFIEKKKLANLISIKYKIKEGANIVLDNLKTQLDIETEIPKTFGCLDCVYYRPKTKICKYYNKFLKKIKKECADFRQK